ncbi:hypothetical protein ACIQXF_11285 [Lysinibacillus sp. NPDC097231]|uniref:hypothetical protein n=1 Tax=Lysinibacillus sp. NPDC097231 TaxID=3364142 RepID=UPI00382C22A5
MEDRATDWAVKVAERKSKATDGLDKMTERKSKTTDGIAKVADRMSEVTDRRQSDGWTSHGDGKKVENDG